MNEKMNAGTGRFRQKVLAFMRKNHMTDRGDGVLAAVSGGADSACLLLLLCELAAELGIHVFAFHMNHGIRGAEADRDERFVKELCGRMGVPLTVVHEKVGSYAADHGLSTEEAGRILRYRHLKETAEKYGCAKIAVAHHEDDDAETVLLNLFRGSGLPGLSGIRPVRAEIIRPLLCVSRKEIEEYLTSREHSWCEDSTNKENDYTRNKIRNELLPWVTENINSRAAEHILAVSEFAAKADAYFEAEAERVLRESERKEKSRTGNSVKIRTEILDPQPEILKTYIIRRMILNAAGKAKDITERHIRLVMDLSGPGGGCIADLPYGLQAVRGYETLEIRKVCQVGEKERREKTGDISAYKFRKNAEDLECTEVKMAGLKTLSCEALLDTEKKKIDPEAGERKILQLGPTMIRLHVTQRKKELEIPKNQYTKWFDYDKIKDGLSIRYRKNGDYFTLSGGGKKKLGRFMIDEKIPEKERDRIPVLADGYHILWVIGYRISDYYKITDETERVLEAEMILPDGGDRSEDGGGRAGIWNCKGEDHG